MCRSVLGNLITPTIKRLPTRALLALILAGVIGARYTEAALSFVLESPHMSFCLLLIAAAMWHSSAIIDFERRIRYQWKISKWSGIARVYPIAPYPELRAGRPYAADPLAVWQQAVDAMQTVVQHPHTTRLQLLLVSGWRMIGCDVARGILYEQLSRLRKCHIEILLLNPASPAAVDRARAIDLSPDQYQKGVQAVLWTLGVWQRSKGVNITAYFYNEEPIWQMVMTKLEIWLLCAAENIATGQAPIYCLRRDAECGLAFGFEAVWKRRLATATQQDLSNTPEPDWRSLKHLPEVPERAEKVQAHPKRQGALGTAL